MLGLEADSKQEHLVSLGVQEGLQSVLIRFVSLHNLNLLLSDVLHPQVDDSLLENVIWR